MSVFILDPLQCGRRILNVIFFLLHSSLLLVKILLVIYQIFHFSWIKHWSPNTQTQVLCALLLPPSCCNMVHEVSVIWGGSRDNQRVAGGKKGWGEWGGWGVLHSNCMAQVGWRCLRSALSFKEGKLMFFFPKHNIVREVYNGKLLPVFPCVCHKLENTQVDSALVAWTTDYLIQSAVCM